MVRAHRFGLLGFGLVALAWMAAFPAAAAGPKLFGDAAPLKLTLTAPFPALVNAAKTKTDAFPASLSVSQGDGPAQTLAIQLRARGLTRRTSNYCNFPPLSLVFNKATTKGTPFQGQGKLKLVTYCRVGADFEQRIVLEHLAYRIYNLLTPMSYRVRTADVTYRTGPTDKGVTRFGYLIEDIDDVADRNNRDVLKLKSHEVDLAQLDAHAAARVTLFEFMLGNLDWELLAVAGNEPDCCHNARLLAAKKSTPATARAVVPVPYDFDFSGFVDSPYAGPAPGVDIANLRERFYRGYCPTNGEVASVIQEFRAHRAEMTALINNEARLTDAFRNKTTKFLDSFFAILDDPGQVDRKITKHCR